MKKVITVCLVLSVLLVSGCFSKEKKVEPIFKDQGITPEDEVGRYTVNITKDGFATKDLSINLGDTVTWKNDDQTVHKIKVAEQPGIPLNPGNSWTYKFEEPGTFAFICVKNEAFKGQVVVK